MNEHLMQTVEDILFDEAVVVRTELYELSRQDPNDAAVVLAALSWLDLLQDIVFSH